MAKMVEKRTMFSWPDLVTAFLILKNKTKKFEAALLLSII